MADLEKYTPTSERPSRFWPRTKKVLFWSVLSLMSVYVVAIMGAICAQSHLVYMPRKESLSTPSSHGWLEDEWECVTIRTDDKETLVCYWLKYHKFNKSAPSPSTAPFTLIHFHGNAGNISSRFTLHQELMDKLHYNVLMVGYRGFGESSGRPSEAGMKLDAQAALNWTLKRLPGDEERSRIVVYGQSLGGAVAINLAANNPSAFKYLKSLRIPSCQCLS